MILFGCGFICHYSGDISKDTSNIKTVIFPSAFLRSAILNFLTQNLSERLSNTFGIWEILFYFYGPASSLG